MIKTDKRSQTCILSKINREIIKEPICPLRDLKLIQMERKASLLSCALSPSARRAERRAWQGVLTHFSNTCAQTEADLPRGSGGICPVGLSSALRVSEWNFQTGYPLHPFKTTFCPLTHTRGPPWYWASDWPWTVFWDPRVTAGSLPGTYCLLFSPLCSFNHPPQPYKLELLRGNKVINQ